MKNFAQILAISALSLLTVAAYYGSTRGFGLRDLNNANIRAEAQKQTIRNGGHSYFWGRTIRGGGMRFGK